MTSSMRSTTPLPRRKGQSEPRSHLAFDRKGRQVADGLPASKMHAGASVRISTRLTGHRRGLGDGFYHQDQGASSPGWRLLAAVPKPQLEVARKGARPNRNFSQRN